MTSGSQLTHILLERGTEDMELLAELHRITAQTKIVSIKKFIKKYPLIHELKQKLMEERRRDLMV